VKFLNREICVCAGMCAEKGIKMAMISNDWLAELKDEFHQPYCRKLYEFVTQEYDTRQIFPPPSHLLSLSSVLFMAFYYLCAHQSTD